MERRRGETCGEVFVPPLVHEARRNRPPLIPNHRASLTRSRLRMGCYYSCQKNSVLPRDCHVIRDNCFAGFFKEGRDGGARG